MSSSSRSGTLACWLISIAAGVLLAGGISFASYALLAPEIDRGPQEVNVTIPPGTAERIRSGAPVTVVPRDLRFVAGDTLVLSNQDVAEHNIGSFFVRPGGSVRIPLSATAQSLACSFHPDGSISLAVAGRRDPLKMLIPTFALGIPFGVGLALAITVARRLGSP